MLLLLAYRCCQMQPPNFVKTARLSNHFAFQKPKRIIHASYDFPEHLAKLQLYNETVKNNNWKIAKKKNHTHNKKQKVKRLLGKLLQLWLNFNDIKKKVKKTQNTEKPYMQNVHKK